MRDLLHEKVISRITKELGTMQWRDRWQFLNGPCCADLNPCVYLRIQGVANVGSQLWVCETQFIIVLFIQYCIIFHINNCKPIFVPPCGIVISILQMRKWTFKLHDFSNVLQLILGRGDFYVQLYPTQTSTYFSVLQELRVFLFLFCLTSHWTFIVFSYLKSEWWDAPRRQGGRNCAFPHSLKEVCSTHTSTCGRRHISSTSSLLLCLLKSDKMCVLWDRRKTGVDVRSE